jgi:cell division protein FtsW
MLVLVLNKHFGVVRGHARRWFSFGGMHFQPSEFAKVALIITLAWYGERFQRQMLHWKRGILIPGLLIGLTVGLIFKEPDVGNALVLAVVSGILLLTAGIRLRYFLPPVLAAVIGIGVFIYHNPMRSERIYSWLHVEETRRDKGLQAYEAMVALGSGGLAGKGLGDGRQKLGFLPEHHTDFIFSIIGEELGLIATLLVVVAFVAILFCGIYVALNAVDTFGLLLGSGITFLIGLQAFINIGVVTSALPNKGLPLPFISYGGSNLLIMLASLASRARRERPMAAFGISCRRGKEPTRLPGPHNPDHDPDTPTAGPSRHRLRWHRWTFVSWAGGRRSACAARLRGNVAHFAQGCGSASRGRRVGHAGHLLTGGRPEARR